MADGLMGFVGPLQKLLGTFQRERHFLAQMKAQQEKDRREALEAILTALSETRRYIDSLPDVYDRDTEYRLSELWAIAAIRSRKSIESIQPEMLAKSQYWLDKIRWSRQVVEEKGIDLETMEQKFRELIAEQ
jgi:hypothetical protein